MALMAPTVPMAPVASQPVIEQMTITYTEAPVIQSPGKQKRRRGRSQDLTVHVVPVAPATPTRPVVIGFSASVPITKFQML